VIRDSEILNVFATGIVEFGSPLEVEKNRLAFRRPNTFVPTSADACPALRKGHWTRHRCPNVADWIVEFLRY